MNGFTKGALMASGWALRGLSIGCTGWLCFQLADGEGAAWLMATGGMVIQLTAFVLLPPAVLWLKGKRFWLAVPALVYCSLVFLVSTGAAVTFLEYGEQMNRQALAVDETTQLYKEAARLDMANGFRSRALETLGKVSQREEHGGNSTTVASVLAQLYGVSPEALRGVVWLVFALLMDGGAVLASVLPVLAGREQRAQERENVPEEQEAETFLGSGSEAEEQISQPAFVLEEQTTELGDYEQARGLVLSLQAGEKISVRHVKDRLRVGYSKARQLADQLLAERLILKSGNSYIVAGRE